MSGYKLSLAMRHKAGKGVRICTISLLCYTSEALLFEGHRTVKLKLS